MDVSSAPAPPGVWAKTQGFVAARPTVAIAVMVLAVLGLVFALVYYRGIGPLGPYATEKFAPTPRDEEEEEAPRRKRRGGGSGVRRKRHVPPAGSDSETEDLAAQIEDQIEESN